jgi:uncharacterized protein (DUF1501 family)
MSHLFSRRDFMKTAAVFSALGVAPQFLTRTAEAAAQSIHGFKDDRVLVVVQLGGGNDGLNTLVPYSDDAYYNARPQLGLKSDRLLTLNDDVAFNSRMEGLKRLYDDAKLAIVQGVGYPNPDRSHFRSMEIWQTASDSDEFLGTGWVGRYFDATCSGSARPQAGVALGKERPQAFDGEKGFGVAFENPGNFGWQPGDGADNAAAFARANSRDLPAANSVTLDFLRHVTSDAIMSSKEVHEAAMQAGKIEVPKGRQQLGVQLDTVAALIRGGLQTRIYYVSISGFDTHANQLGQQDNLLANAGNALLDFQDRLRADGTADRVATMVFSEFGRRVHENKSGGTDHGTAAPMFLVGDHIKPGLHGAYPSLTKLDDGDLIHTVDFRQVYAAVLNDWFAVDPKAVLGKHFNPLGVIA